MGGSKMIPEMTCGVKMPRKFSWVPITERPEDKGTKKHVHFKMPKDSFHQIPRETYPRSPTEWRTYEPEPQFIQPRIVEQPDEKSLRKPCIYRKKLEKEKKQAMKKKSDFLLSKFIKSVRTKQKEVDIWQEKLRPERLKVLVEYLASPLELEQLHAAQALGQLGVADESVLSALHHIFQESNNLSLQYEAARSLVLLGCFETPVVKMLVRHLKDVKLNRQEDTLVALRVSLKAWSLLPTYERCCIGAHKSLIRNLQRLVDFQAPTDETSFGAALCLGYLNRSCPIAQEIMFMCLNENDRKKKMQALVMLVKHMGIMDATIIQKILEQLQHSLVGQDRADSAKLLSIIGLETIQEEGLEDVVFDVLLEKLSEEPFLIVRQCVALTVEALKMKKQVWEIVEKHRLVLQRFKDGNAVAMLLEMNQFGPSLLQYPFQLLQIIQEHEKYLVQLAACSYSRNLKDENEAIRKRAVIALGVLGIRNKTVFFTMLEMLELDTSEDVRIQVVKAFSTLGMNNVHVRKRLWRKAQTEGVLARECSKALKILDKVSVAQKELMVQAYKLN